jgi:hypothetical protein
MKNYAKVLVFAAIVALIVVPAQAAGWTVPKEMCDLIGKMQGVFKTLRVLAFVGAGFYMAGWAWDYIKGGEAKFDDMKKKGIGLLVGFTILFAIGIVITFLMGAAGENGETCAQLKNNW